MTEADRAAEAKRCARPSPRRYPDHGIVGEELGERRRHAAAQTWWIDPIDGTKAFITGSPLWGTLIGLTLNDAPVLGLMNQPFTGERYWSGRGCRLVPRAARRRASASRRETVAEIAAAVVSTTSPDLLDAGFERERFEALSAPGTPGVATAATATPIASSPAGHLDLVVEAGLKPHDIVALIPIIERAGGVVSGWDWRTPAAAGGRIVAAGDPESARNRPGPA